MKKNFKLWLASLVFVSLVFGCKNGVTTSNITAEADISTQATGLIKDPLLLKLINKTLDKNRKDDEPVTLEQLESIAELSIFLDNDGKPDFNENAKDSILGEPKNLSGTTDFKFAVSRGIKNISGLEHCKNLKKLKLNENEIADLSPLKNLTKLTYLEMSRNRIVDLKPIAGLTKLTFLKLYDNLIEDITPIQNLTNLTSLDLHYNVKVEGDENNKIISNGITDISSLKNLKELTFLDISANRISDVKTILNFDKIVDLDFSGNNVTDYTGLEEYIAPRYAKMLNEGEGSINFYAQTAIVETPIKVENHSASFDSPFTGIEELSKKVGEQFGNTKHFFEDADLTKIEINGQSSDESSFKYNASDKKFTINFDKALCSKYKNTVQSVKLTVSFDNMPWYIIVPVEFGEATEILPQEYQDFYFNFFNDWNNFYKKYTNLTDEANKKFSETNKPKKDKNFTKDDFAMLKQFVVTDKSITDAMLAPLKYATNLEYFRIELSDKNLKRNINDFYFLKSMPKLKIFYYINQDSDFDLNLKEQLPHIDFSNNRLLEDVRICKTRQADFQFLQGLNLKTVSLQDNEISDISVLENMNNLERIDLDNNKISKLCDFTKLSNLITLYLLDNPISDISNLSSLKNLEALHLRNTNINDISVLKELPKLHRLYIDKNEHLPTDYFSVIKELKTLNGLYVDTINAEEFEWLKDFAIRKAEPATFNEDAVRLFEFQNLLYEFEIPENKISENKFEITNPLKNWDNAYIEQDTYESENPNLAFSDDKIIVTKTSSENEFYETYNLYIENAKHTFGEWDQPASIAGKVTLKFKIITPSISTTETNGLPRIYDLRNVDGKSFVTPVKNQYKDGACRSFASIAALESSILKNEGVTLDLSENNMETRHGFYFQGKKRREGRSRESDIPYLINGTGPILETEDPYIPMRDKNGLPAEYLTQEQVEAASVVTNKNRVRLVMGFQFLKTIDVKALTFEEDENLVQVKKAIMEYGAVVCNIYMAHDGNETFPYTNSKYYNMKNYTYYADGYDDKYEGKPNHAVSIVGWDDNFKKDRFTTQPPIDGAWIVKDAQGETFGDLGYFYVSFASVSMGDEPYVFTDIRKADEYAGIFQHDEVAFSSFISWNKYSDDNKHNSVLFNVFTSENNNKSLCEVGFYTTKPNAECKVYLIKDFENFKRKADDCADEYDFDELLTDENFCTVVFDGIEETAGYHTKKLSEEFSLSEGKKFALGIWTKNNNAEDPEHKWDIVVEKKEELGLGRYAKANVGETFVFGFGMFTDEICKTEKINACIKGYYKNF